MNNKRVSGFVAGLALVVAVWHFVSAGGPPVYQPTLTSISGILPSANGGTGVNNAFNLTVPATGTAIISGGTGDATNLTASDPAALTGLATKNYVDQVAGGLAARSARLATAAILPNTPAYLNGVAGVGATLISTAFGALTVDGTSVSIGDRILVKNEAATANNGIYSVTLVGSGAAFYTLTRSIDSDDTNDFNSVLVSIQSGTANANTDWLCTAGAGVTVGTTAITFSQYQVGAGTTLGGDLSGTVGSAVVTNVDNSICGERLTLTSVTPVTTADVNNSALLYMTPYRGNRIALYNGTRWIVDSFAEQSIATTGLTIYGLYDVFAFDNAGTPNLELLQWTSTAITITGATNATPIVITAANTLSNGDEVGISGITGNTAANGTWVVSAVSGSAFTLNSSVGNGVYGGSPLCQKLNVARATALVLQNGVLCKTGVLTRRYLGTFLAENNSNASAATDAAGHRDVYNYYNRVPRNFLRQDSTNSWTYTTATYRQANGSILNEVTEVNGWAESAVSIIVSSIMQNSSAIISAKIAVGVDSTTTNSGDVTGVLCPGVASQNITGQAVLNTVPAVGFHKFIWLEQSTATGTATWFGNGGAATIFQSGITGYCQQ